MHSTLFSLKSREGMAFSFSSQIELKLRATRMQLIWKYLHRSSSESRFLSKASLNTLGQPLLFIPRGGDAWEMVCSLQGLGRGTKASFLWKKQKFRFRHKNLSPKQPKITSDISRSLSEVKAEKHRDRPIDRNARSLCTRDAIGGNDRQRNFQNTSAIYS